MYNLPLSFWALEISSLNESSKRVLGLEQLIKTVLDFPPCRHVPPLQRFRQGIPTVLWAQLLVTAKQQSSNVWSDNWPHSQHTTTRPLGTIPTCRIHYNVFLATIIEGTSLSNTESCHKPVLHQCSPQLSRTRRSLCSVLQEGKMRLLSMKTRWRRRRKGWKWSATTTTSWRIPKDPACLVTCVLTLHCLVKRNWGLISRLTMM